MIKQRDNEPRIAYLLRVLEAYMNENGQPSIDYDGTTCDGMCLFEDILSEVNPPVQTTGFIMSYSDEAREAISLELSNASAAMEHRGAKVKSGGISVVYQGAERGRLVSIKSDLVLFLGDDVP